MIKKIFLFFFYLNICNLCEASFKNEIITRFKKIENISFHFTQKIDKKTEYGNCIIQYPKKIYCSYDNILKKILVSNGKKLVIKNIKNNQYYIYSLKKTPLDLILDKYYLINQIEKIEGKIIDNKYYNFSLNEENNKINIFFDKENYNLIGWKTEDIYQNLVITLMDNIEINKEIDEKYFILPKR